MAKKKHKWSKKGVAQCENCGLRRVKAQSTGKFEYWMAQEDGTEDVQKRPGACVPPPEAQDTPEPPPAPEEPREAPQEAKKATSSTGCSRCGGKGLLPTDEARARGRVRRHHPEDWQPCHECQ